MEKYLRRVPRTLEKCSKGRHVARPDQKIFKGHVTNKSLYKTETGTYVKKWGKDNANRYFQEKKFYTRLKISNHFPDLINYPKPHCESKKEIWCFELQNFLFFDIARSKALLTNSQLIRF